MILEEFTKTGTTKFIDAKKYGGVIYRSRNELAKKLNIKYRYLLDLLNKNGFTEEQLIDKFNAGEKI
jgi:hypothetical protein